ncbi:hypothetical protein [Pedobacter arcticus]|uniref:hypothetical protein n=1 Tax=Pedobacter arcticus TaxID=752140 RepID=UPI0002DFCA3D|nr:hypothetical protein [Pedobacter arcticus]
MTVEYQGHLTEYIAKCVNKDKPQLHCNGQCVFMKKMKQQDEKQAKKNLVAYEYSAFYIHNECYTINLYTPKEEINESQFSPYLIGYRFNYHTSIFRPPVSDFIPVVAA